MPERETLFQYLYGWNHWWARSMREAATNVILKFSEGRTIVDLGCGTGHLGVELQRHGKRYLGCDLDIAAVSYAKALGNSESQILHTDAVELISQLPHEEKYFLCLLDLWTQKSFDQHKFLLSARNSLGAHRLLIRAPAYNHLKGRHDEWVNQTERINPSRLKLELEKEGYHFVFGTHLNLILLPFYLLVRMFPVSSGLNKSHCWGLNWILYNIMKAEHKLIERRSLCYGMTYLMVLDYEDPDIRK
jgi:SAM-dependent methyltransferase